MMVSCLLYGFQRGWRSSRELQKACEENDAMRYLVGGHKIKFRGIADFRVRFGKELEEVFNFSVSLLCHKDKSIGKDVKIDGTKIKASAADDQTYKKSDLEARQESLREELLQYLSSRYREQCCTSKEELRRGYRSMSVDPSFALKHEMIKKMNSAEAKSFYKKRGSEIEPIFGILKQAKNFHPTGTGESFCFEVAIRCK